MRDGHTEALSGADLLRGEGHFRWLDTVGDRREGGGGKRGLLKKEREKGRKTEGRERPHIPTPQKQQPTSFETSTFGGKVYFIGIWERLRCRRVSCQRRSKISWPERFWRAAAGHNRQQKAKWTNMLKGGMLGQGHISDRSHA